MIKAAAAAVLIHGFLQGCQAERQCLQGVANGVVGRPRSLNLIVVLAKVARLPDEALMIIKQLSLLKRLAEGFRLIELKLVLAAAAAVCRLLPRWRGCQMKLSGSW
jgi:hypothetical protein